MFLLKMVSGWQKWVAVALVLGAFLTWLRADAVSDYIDRATRESLVARIDEINDGKAVKEKIDEIPDSDLVDYGSKWVHPTDPNF